MSKMLEIIEKYLKELKLPVLSLGTQRGVVAVVVIGSAIFFNYVVKDYLLRRRMPPGPLGLPFIGNQHQMPARKPWKKFEEFNKKYGSVISLFFGRTPIIVCGTAQAAWDLLEKRSDIYSSRPRFIMAGEILSEGLRGLMLPYGEDWRKWRKVLHAGFHSRQAAKYKEIQTLESKQAMFQILNDPKHWERHLQRYAASVVVSVSYGRRIESVDEWIVTENMAAMDYLTKVNIPGKYIVESWPWLLKLPRSLQWFRRDPEAQKIRDQKLYLHLLEDVKKRLETGSIPDCLAVQTWQNSTPMGGKNGLSELEVAYAISSPFGAGIETTSGTLSSFILAMLHNPHVLAAAQAELDQVVGFDRMPEYDDFESLPYIRAVVNETLRWRPIAVLGGTPHAVMKDDEYNGMFIPRGATVFANMYGIMRDPEMFPDPEKFDPNRFLHATDPRLVDFDLPFGFGRRVCPGMHLARNSLFINLARICWGFNIRPARDPKTGKEILPDVYNYTDGFNSLPVSFDCDISVRNDKVKETIISEYKAAQPRLGVYQW